MNIGLFNENFPPIYDGVVLSVINYAYWLKQKGHNIRVITPDAPGKDDTAFAYPIHRYFSLPLLGRRPYRWGLPMFDKKFHQTISELPFDLIHAHTPFSSGNIALDIARKRNIPIIATFHSKYRSDIERQVPFKFIVDKMVKDIVKFFNQVDEVWIPQDSVEKTLRDYGYQGPVHVMPNGSDFSNLDVPNLRAEGRKHLGIEENEMVLLYVGQHIWEKNIELILRSLSLIKNMPFRFITVGRGYASKEIMKKAEDLGIGNRIQMLGQVSDRVQLQRIYAASDLFLFPSLYDTFGLVVREAAALNVPSLLVRGSDASNSISDGVNGFISENKPRMFARHLRHLLENPAVIKTAGRRASETLISTWEDIVDDVIDRYNFIIEEKKRKPAKLQG